MRPHSIFSIRGDDFTATSVAPVVIIFKKKTIDTESLLFTDNERLMMLFPVISLVPNGFFSYEKDTQDFNTKTNERTNKQTNKETYR